MMSLHSLTLPQQLPSGSKNFIRLSIYFTDRHCCELSHFSLIYIYVKMKINRLTLITRKRLAIDVTLTILCYLQKLLCQLRFFKIY